MKQKQKLLLLADVDSLGKKGEVVSAKPGYVRNFLLPQRFAMIANPHTLRKQERLRAERLKQAAVDQKEAEVLAAQIAGISLEIRVKVDPEGHMYGSVSAQDIAELFHKMGLPVERKYIQLTRPIKTTGRHALVLKLKEGVPASCTLSIIPEGVTALGIEEVTAPLSPSDEETLSSQEDSGASSEE